MPNHNAKFVSAVFAGVLAGSNFIPALNNSAHAEDNCLAAPNAQTPHGSHWYYRIEHGTKRHCWYLREEGDAHSQSAAATSSPAPASPPPAPAKQAPAKADAAMQGSVANARAELPRPQPRTVPETPAPAAALAPAPAAAPVAPAPAAPPAAPTGQLPAAAAPSAQLPPPAMANAPGGDNTPPSIPTEATGNADTPQSGDMSQATIASRWPDQLNANASDDSAPAADNSSTNSQLDATSAPPPPAAASAPPTAADAPPPASRQPGSMQGLLTIMIAALALAGLVGGAIMRFGRRKREEDHADLDRRPVWDSEYDDRPLRYPAAAAHRPNIGRPRELRTVEPDDAIKEMLARLARSAQT